MQQGYAGPMQATVVHVEQLTPEVMAHLSEDGYRAVRDPDLIIFLRRVPGDVPADTTA